jgi:non-ribosomal peptide synthetase component F
VEVVNLAGEALGRGLVEAVYEQLPGSAVYNLYGPSEDTTYSTVALIARGGARGPAIGRPIANTEVYVLDQRGQVTRWAWLGSYTLAAQDWHGATGSERS